MSLQNNCLYCNSDKIMPGKELPIYFNEKEFTWNKCKNCGLLFLLPPLCDDDKEKMYNSGYHEVYYFNYTEDYSRQLELIEPYEKKTFLDYGCGDAGLLNFLLTNSYAVSGVEYNINMVEKLVSKFRDIDFIVEREFWDITEKYDIIHLGDVLEHVSNPIKLIEQLKDRLNPGGIFFIEGPLECNPCLGYYFRKCTYFIRYIFNRESLRVKYPYHITYSNAKNQQLFFSSLQLEKKCFKVIEAGWPYIDTINEIKSPWLFLQYLIAKVSILISAIIPGWGNRFIYIGIKK